MGSYTTIMTLRNRMAIVWEVNYDVLVSSSNVLLNQARMLISRLFMRIGVDRTLLEDLI